MVDFSKITAGIKPVANIGENTKASSTQSFSDVLAGALRDTISAQKTAEQLSVAVANGEQVPMHQVTEAVAQAELKLQTLMSVRDRAVSAYQQILQMPI